MSTLEKYVKSGNSTPEIDFIYYYAFYLKIKRFKANKKAKPGMLVGNLMLAESDLNQIRSELETRVDSLDGFLLYILGLVLLDQSQLENARDILIKSINKYSCNWSAWKALAAACPDYNVTKSLALPDHFMTVFFEAHVLIDLQHCEQGLRVAQSLSRDFPDSLGTISAMAMAHNHLRNYDVAQEMFEKMLSTWPHMIEVRCIS